MSSDAKTIDDVVARLNRVIDEAAAAQDRIGFFAALYNRVTQAVRTGIANRAFADNARMERFDVIFANRYLEALDRYRAGEAPSASWLVAFEATRRPELPALAHLYLGMTAHIGLDLGVAAARVAPGAAIAGLKGDFEKINTVLASLLTTVKQENEAIAPLVGMLAAAGGRLVDDAANEAMALARGSAWSFAVELARLGPTEQASAIARRDALTAASSRAWVLGEPLLHLLQWHQRGDVSNQIAVLAAGEARAPTVA